MCSDAEEEVTTDTEHYWDNRQYCGSSGNMVGNICGPEVFSRNSVIISLEELLDQPSTNGNILEQLKWRYSGSINGTAFHKWHYHWSG